MLELDIVNFSCDVVGKAQCHKAVFCCDYKQHIIDQVVDWQLAKRRSGTSSTRGISDISGTTAKPHKQKGTGRARQGSLRSPQFRGGAVIFGPKPRDYSYKLNKKIRKQALRALLSHKLLQNRVFILESGKLEQKRTAYLLSCPLFANKNSILIIDNIVDNNVRLACRALPNFNVLPCEGMNVYDLLMHDNLFLTKDSLPVIESRLGDLT
jgi:large subunit ribosomal protein L4